MKGFFKIFGYYNLIQKNSGKNWMFISFLVLLPLIMIYSSHVVDSKIHEIARKNKEVKEYRTRFVDGRSRLMKLQMESKVLNSMGKNGVKPSVDPPYKIIVE